MVIVKFSLLVLKISLLIFLQNHLTKRDLTSFEMNLGLLILNLWNKSVYVEWIIGWFYYMSVLQNFYINFISEQFTRSVLVLQIALPVLIFLTVSVFSFSFTISGSILYQFHVYT